MKRQTMGIPAETLLAALRDPKAYVSALRTLRDDSMTSRVPLPLQDGVDFMTIYNHKLDFSRVLARAVSRGEYCNTDNPYLSQHEDGARQIQYSLTDLILQVVVAKETHKVLSHNGLINNDASSSDKLLFIHDMADYIHHQKQTGCESFFIAQYNINLSKAGSLLVRSCPCWQQICRASFNTDSEQLVHDIIDYVYRPIVKKRDGCINQLVVLAPQSARLKQVFIHADLCQLDAKLLEAPTIFYKRTLDKMVIIARSANELQDIETLVQAYSASENRVIELIKTRSVYLTDVKKPYQKSDLLMTPVFNLFEMALFFDGSLGLHHHTLDTWFNDLKLRLQATAALTATKPLHERATILVQFIHSFLEENIVNNASQLSNIMRHINNTNQLKYIDREIAFLLASILSGHQRTRSFNIVPGWKIRNVWKLKSIRYFLSRTM